MNLQPFLGPLSTSASQSTFFSSILLFESFTHSDRALQDGHRGQHRVANRVEYTVVDERVRHSSLDTSCPDTRRKIPLHTRMAKV